MADFYLKIKSRNNEIEFSTDNEQIFNEKVKDFLRDFSGLKNTNTEEYFGENAAETPTEIPTETQELCGFIDIEENLETVNQIQNNNNQNITQEFEQILDKVQETPTVNFVEPENSNLEFQTFIASQNPQNELDYLIFTAKFFNEYLNKQNFTLKQINSKTVPFKNVAVSHKTLNEAVEKGFIMLVPDYTQTSVTKEYCLTPAGENEYHHE